MRPSRARTSLLLASVMVAAMAMPVAVLATSKVTHQRIEGALWNDCTNEELWMDAHATFFLEQRLGSDGFYHIKAIQFEEHGTAVGLSSGALYVLNSTQHTTEEPAQPAQADEFTTTQ